MREDRETTPPHVRVTADHVAWGFVILGVIACVVRYTLCFPIWPDEAFLAISLARHTPGELLGPLDYHQIAPPLFLLVQSAAVGIGGFNELSLRAVPFLCAAASLFVFRSVARMALPRWPHVFAVGILSVSYWVIRYGAESKPYAVDLLVSLVMIWAALRWARSPSGRWPLVVALCGVSLVGFGLSFPSVFVGGGVVVYMATSSLRPGTRVGLAHAALVGACLVAGFVSVYLLHSTHRMVGESAWMQSYWERAFPPLWPAADTVVWIVRRATGELMPYPIGGKDFGSTATVVCCIAGVYYLARHGDRRLLALFGAILALAIVAAAMKRYPFGAPTRCQLYLAPVFAMLAGAGLAWLLHRESPEVPGPVRRTVPCCVLVAVALGAITRDIANPSKTTTDVMLRDMARTLWRGERLAGERSLCLREDLGVSFSPGFDHLQSLLPSFLCNYHIYAKPERRGDPDIDPAAGIRVVSYAPGGQADATLRRDWIESFEAEHALRMTGSVLLPIPDVDKHDRVKRIDTLEIFQFAPRPIAAAGGAPVPPSRAVLEPLRQRP